MNVTTNNERLSCVKSAGFILKPNCKEIKEIYLEIKSLFERNNIEVILEDTCAKDLEVTHGVAFDQLCKKVDFLVTLGGDGTLISVARRGFEYQKPVMGINLGTLGFLTDLMPDEIDSFLKKFINDQYRIDDRMMIKAIINGKKVVAFNDIVITRKDVTSMIQLEGYVDEKIFNKYKADGLIVSTPTGSTAYNLSCHGPVVFPLTDAFIVTPISPHSLTQRSLVLPVDFKIKFKNVNKESAVVVIDGHDTYDLENEDTITIQIASKKAKLIHRLERNYFDVLNKKLHWGASK